MNFISYAVSIVMPTLLVLGVYISYRSIVYRRILFYRYTLCFFLLRLVTEFCVMWLHFLSQPDGNKVCIIAVTRVGTVFSVFSLVALVLGCYSVSKEKG